MTKGIEKYLEAWSRLSPDDCIDLQTTLQFLASPRRLGEYRPVLDRRFPRRRERTNGEVYRERLQLMLQAAGRGLFVDGRLSDAEGPRFSEKRLLSVAPVIGCSTDDLAFFRDRYSFLNESFHLGNIHHNATTTWFQPKDDLRSLRDEAGKRYTKTIENPDPKRLRFRDIVEHLLESPGCVVAAASLVDLGATDFVVVELDRHFGLTVKSSGLDEERLVLPAEARVFESVYDDTTDERLRICIRAFGTHPVLIWSSVRGVYAGWATPSSRSLRVDQVQTWARECIEKAGGRVEAGWIEVRTTSRLPLGPGSRVLTCDFQPMFPLSWQTKGQELAEFHRALRERHSAIGAELLPVSELGAEVDSRGQSTWRLPLSAAKRAEAERLWDEGLHRPNSLNESLLLLNRLLQAHWGMSAAKAAGALWNWCLTKNNGLSADMASRPHWVRRKVDDIAHGLEGWIQRLDGTDPVGPHAEVDRTTDESPPLFSVGEIRAIVEIADRDLELETTRLETRPQAGARSLVDPSLERFLAGVIRIAKQRGHSAAADGRIEFTMSYRERDC